MKCYYSHILLFMEIWVCQAVYDRKALQRQYPGFGDEFVIFPRTNGKEVYGYLRMMNQQRFLGQKELRDLEKQIYFIYFSRSAPVGKKIKSTEDLRKYYDSTKKVKFITHGWLSSSKSNMADGLRKAYLNKTDVNVIVTDWTAISDNIYYPVPMMATPDVATYFAKFLNVLVDEVLVDPDDIHLIGHSLGAQISGFAGRRVKKGKIGRITALDPALPGFSSLFSSADSSAVKDGHVTANDAKFVDVIHTCAGFLGMKYPIGHVDFYPNGGEPPQPGCDILKFIEACSHSRSWKLFEESILIKNAYFANQCSSFDTLTNRNCSGKDVIMGDPTPHDTRGIYFVKTSGSQPYIWNWNYTGFIDNQSLEE